MENEDNCQPIDDRLLMLKILLNQQKLMERVTYLSSIIADISEQMVIEKNTNQVSKLINNYQKKPEKNNFIRDIIYT